VNNSILNIGFILKDLNAYQSHVKPFFDNAPHNKYYFFVFHINKYYSHQKEINYCNIKFIDLTLNKNINKTLKFYKIDFLLSINPGNIFDLFVSTVAKNINIPTAYYQHGLQLDFTSFNPKILFQSSSFIKKINSIRKYSFFYFLFFINIISSSNKIFLMRTVWLKTLILLNKRDIAILPKYGLKENHVDYAFMFGEIDKNYLISSMNMDSRNIFITGYPFLQYDKYNFSNKKLINKKTRKALYLSTALRATGVSPITIEEEKMFYQKLFKQVDKAGYKLILKLHPLEDPLLFKSYFNGMDVEILSNVNLADLCYESDLVIGEYTTTFFYAIREKKPIIIINSNYFNEYPFDFTKFGIGVKSDIDELATVISKNKNLTRANMLAYEKFSRNYINYNGCSYNKIYNHIENILDYN